MRIQTTRFGEIDVRQEDRLVIVDGLLGFGGLTRYVLYRPEGLDIFLWLQSEEVPQLAFVVCAPRVIVPDYHIDIAREELEGIELEDETDADILVLLAHPHDPSRMTANLMGPVVVNRGKGLAKQVVLSSAEYSAKHKVFPHLKPREEHTEQGDWQASQECA